MRGLEQLLKVARTCTLPIEAERLVREETESRTRTFDDLTKEHARTMAISNIRYVLRCALSEAEAAPLLALFGK